MRFHKLRIAWSVFWGFALALLIALSVRSYKICDLLSKRDATKQSTTIGSGDGVLYFVRTMPRSVIPTIGWPRSMPAPPPAPLLPPHGWQHTATEANVIAKRFNVDLTPGAELITLPDWIVLMIGSSVASAPWLRWRFSVRTLLVATTLIAGGLGLIAWARGK